MSKKQTGKAQVRNTVVGLLVVVLAVAAVVITLEEISATQGEYRRTVWDRLSGKPGPPEGRAEVSIQVAQELCRQHLERQLGDNLLQARFDRRSSRYNKEYRVHTVFMDLQLRDGEDDPYARCDVSAVQRMILEVRIQGRGNLIWG